MRCYFCQQPCQSDNMGGEVCPQHTEVHHYQYVGREETQQTDFLWFQYRHPHNHHDYSVWMYFTISNQRPNFPSCEITCFHFGNDPLIIFPFIPDLTPENISDKLPTILTFL